MFGFGKRELAEEAAASRCVDFFLLPGGPEGFKDAADAIRARLSDLFHDDEVGERAVVEFMVACLAGECQALPNLFDTDQAGRLRRHIDRRLHSLDAVAKGGPPVVEPYKVYSQAWRRGIQTPPFPGLPAGGVALEFCRRSQLSATTSRSVPNLILLSLLQRDLVMTGGFWKNLRDKHRLVP